MSTWTLTYHARPWSLNDERRRHWSWRNEQVDEWRQAYGWLARQQRIPRCERIMVIARTYMTGRLADPVNQYPAVKAAIDGLIDAGVIPDDSGDHVAFVGFFPPERDKDQRLELQVTSVGVEPTTLFVG